MPKLHFKRSVPQTPEQMLALVADVARYPEFVPNCTSMQLDDLHEDAFDARMQVRFGPITQTYTSHVSVDRTAMTVVADATDGPFAYLNSVWRFQPDETGEGADISFDMDFKISNPLLAAAAEPAFSAKQAEVVDAFVQRAKQIYG